MLNFFKKKKEPEYDITNITIHDLDFGFILDYDLKSWVVKEVYEYDWGDNNFTREYRIDSGDEAAYLAVDDIGELTITVSKAIKIRRIDEDFVQIIQDTEKAPRQIHYNSEVYYLESDEAGYSRDLSKDTEDWEEFMSYEYFNEAENKVLSITQWDEDSFEAFAGKVVESFQISNILPAD